MSNRSSTDPSERLECGLLDSALDFLLSAAESCRRDEGPRSLKDAVLHVANGVELLVKARLAREHWSLIFAQVNVAQYSKVDSADFISVDFSTACRRLENIAGVKVENSGNFPVARLRKLRNRLTHFTSEVELQQAKSLVAKAMAFCVEFCEQQGMVSIDSEDKLSGIHMNLTEFEEFVDERMKNISEELKFHFVWTCPECWQAALSVDAGVVECMFCRKQHSPQELAAKEGEGSARDCPECWTESSLAFVLYNNEYGEWVCFSCGESGANYRDCMRCGEMQFFSEDEDLHICESCWSYVRSRW